MMEYSNYYPMQAGPPPLPPSTMMTDQPDYSMMGGSMNTNSMMHSAPAPSSTQSMRHAPGQPPMQQHHSMSHHQQQPSPHPNYHQLPQHPPISHSVSPHPSVTPHSQGQPSPHSGYHQQPQHLTMSHSASPHPSSRPHSQGQPSPHSNYHHLPSHPPMSHSASPHPSSTPHSQGQPSPRPSTGPSPLHHQMPPYINGQSPKISPSGSMHPSTTMASNSHHHNQHHHQHSSGPHSQQTPHGQVYTGNSMAQQYLQSPVNHQSQGAPPLINQRQQQQQQSIPNGSMRTNAPQSSPSSHMPPQHGNQGMASPFFQHMPQTEFRIIELNKRLQTRPRVKCPPSPLPDHAAHEESNWWERFACDFFDNEATLTVRTPGDVRPIEHTIGRALIPRFFKSYYDGGVTDLSIRLRNIREMHHHSNVTTMECDLADIITKNMHKHSANIYMYVVTEGHLSLDFVSNGSDNLVIKSWRFNVTQCHEYIDRSVANPAQPHANLSEPVTSFGLTKSTRAFLKMCSVMQPMQDLMSLHKQTNYEPRSCLKSLLYDKYKFKDVDEKSAPQPKRRKRKPAEPGATTKKSKANAGTNSIVLNSNHSSVHEADQGVPNPPLASQDVGEPCMLGADFSDSNERRITRIENSQYDPSTENNSHQSNDNTLNENSSKLETRVPANSVDINRDLQLQHQNEAPSLTSQSHDLDSSGNSVQSVSSCPTNGNHTDDSARNNRVPTVREEESDQEHGSATNHVGGDNSWQATNNDLASVLAEEDSTSSSKKTTDRERLAPHDDLHLDDKISPSLADDSSRPVSEEPSEKEVNGVGTGEERQSAVPMRSHLNILNRIPEDREDATCKSMDIGVTKLPPNANTTVVNTPNGCQTVSTKQNRRRSSERKETLREGLMRTTDFVIKIEDLKNEHPLMWRITTGNSLLQQFEPKAQNGTVLYENTHQYHGWNDDIRRDCVGVDVKLTQHTRNQITVERLLLNFQNLDDPETFLDKHFLIYLQILISTALDPKFWEGIESDPENRDYFLTSRKIIDDIIKRHKTNLASKLKLSETTMKNFEKYPNLMIAPIDSDKQGQPCRACNTTSSTQSISFGDRSYDLHSYKPVKVTSELTSDNNSKDHEISVCDSCLLAVKLYSEVHHLGWRLLNGTLEKIEQLRSKGRSANAVVDELLTDEEWINRNYSERDSLWSRIDQVYNNNQISDRPSQNQINISERRLS